jgi:TonB-dependent starch-binding outer membrane protein SusC
MRKNFTHLLRSVVFAVFVLAISLSTFAQDGVTVNGKVTDNNGQPLEGVTVQEKGTQNTVVTNKEGAFTIRTASGNATLVISSVGYERMEVGAKSSLAISLRQSANNLGEVIVVGYGTQRKSDVTGALSRITAETIQERPVTNVTQALQGKASGLNVSTNIKPGEVPSIRIRGTRSPNTSNEPLYVVDGIPIVAALGVTSFSINDINPNDITSVEILKDASATAIYGSRGANGVILITTKKGARGRTSVSFSSNISIDRYKDLTDYLSAGEYIDRLRQGLINGRRYQASNPTDLNVAAQQWFPDPKLDSSSFSASGVSNNYAELIAAAMLGYERNADGSVKMRATTAAEQAMGWPAQVPVYNSANIPTYDWRKAATRTGIMQNHQVSVASGTEQTRLYLSLGYNKTLGVQRDQDFQRFNLNINGDITPLKWFAMGVSVIASLSEQDFGINANQGNTGAKDLYGRAVGQFPWSKPRDAAGAFIRNPGGNLNLWNPLIDIDQSLNNRRTSAALGNIYAELKFTPWLKYRVNFGAQIRNFRNGAWTGPNVTAHLTARANTASYAREENFSWVVENLLYADKKIGTAHNIGVTLLQSSQKSRRESTNTSVGGVVIPLSLWYDLASNTQGNPGIGTGFTENTLSSFMGRVNYTLLNKYLLTASGRFDGASVLAPGHKWDFFPSFALAWKMQEELFMQGIPWITELKPRIGYGQTGNSSVAAYTTTGPLSRNNYVFGSLPAVGFLPQSVQNPELGWEKTSQINAGLDFILFNSRISGSIEYYNQSTSDLLFTRDLPAVSGYVTKVMNIGKSRNKGIELTLSTVNIQKKDFSWSTDINFSRNKEAIVSLINGAQDMVAQRLFIGQPWQVFYQLESNGIWTNSKADLDEMAKFKSIGGLDFKPGTIRVVDRNNDYKIGAEDYVIRGTPRPKWFGGITNTVRYKRFTFSTFIYARFGQTYFGGYPDYLGRDGDDFWSWSTQTGRFPLPVIGATGITNITSAMQYYDGSFVAVRNISLSYELPANLINRAKIKNVQLNVQVLNPFIFGRDVVKFGINPDDETNWSAQSQPGTFNENPLGGVNNNTILPQSLVFGLRMSF